MEVETAKREIRALAQAVAGQGASIASDAEQLHLHLRSDHEL